MALIFPLLLAMFIGFMATTASIPIESGAVLPTASTYGSEAPGDASVADEFVALSRATLAYTENHPGASGSLSATQLSPYMGNIAFPPSWGALVQNGLVYAWTGSGGSALLPVIQSLSDGDCAYGSAQNGQIVSASKNCPDAMLGATPTSLPDGTPIWTIVMPHN